MDTAIQAVMRAMLQQGWFTKSDGECEAPTGYFGYVTNTKAELESIRDAFSDVIEAYGDFKDEDMIGSFLCVIDAAGGFWTFRKANDEKAKREFKIYEKRYTQWCEN